MISERLEKVATKFKKGNLSKKSKKLGVLKAAAGLKRVEMGKGQSAEDADTNVE